MKQSHNALLFDYGNDSYRGTRAIILWRSRTINNLLTLRQHLLLLQILFCHTTWEMCRKTQNFFQQKTQYFWCSQRAFSNILTSIFRVKSIAPVPQGIYLHLSHYSSWFKNQYDFSGTKQISVKLSRMSLSQRLLIFKRFSHCRKILPSTIPKKKFSFLSPDIHTLQKMTQTNAGSPKLSDFVQLKPEEVSLPHLASHAVRSKTSAPK